MVYNLYNLQASFKKYILSGNAKLSPVSIRNYQSDLRHFLGWYVFYLKASPKYTRFLGDFESDSSLFSILDEKIVEEYKQYLRLNRIPFKTINRRLSTLRKFCSFCISQGWLRDNPAKKIANSGTVKEYKFFLNEFKGALEKDELIPLEIRGVVSDVEEFLSAGKL